MESNGQKSAGKRSRHLNIRFFFVTNQVEKGRIKVVYCPTDIMLGDYTTKPTHRKQFKEFRRRLMNLPPAVQAIMIACYTREHN